MVDDDSLFVETIGRSVSEQDAHGLGQVGGPIRGVHLPGFTQSGVYGDWGLWGLGYVLIGVCPSFVRLLMFPGGGHFFVGPLFC